MARSCFGQHLRNEKSKPGGAARYHIGRIGANDVAFWITDCRGDSVGTHPQHQLANVLALRDCAKTINRSTNRQWPDRNGLKLSLLQQIS